MKGGEAEWVRDDDNSAGWEKIYTAAVKLFCHLPLRKSRERFIQCAICVCDASLYRS